MRWINAKTTTATRNEKAEEKRIHNECRIGSCCVTHSTRIATALQRISKPICVHKAPFSFSLSFCLFEAIKLHVIDQWCKCGTIIINKCNQFGCFFPSFFKFDCHYRNLCVRVLVMSKPMQEDCVMAFFVELWRTSEKMILNWFVPAIVKMAIEIITVHNITSSSF